MGGVRSSVGVPTWIASRRSGSATRSCWTPGRSRVESSAKSARNGRWRARIAGPCSSSGRAVEIESSSACGSAENAAKVLAPFVKSCDCWRATGATIDESRPEAEMKRASPVPGLARFFATGFRF